MLPPARPHRYGAWMVAGLLVACGEPSLVRIVDKPPGTSRYAPRETALATLDDLHRLAGGAASIEVGTTIEIDLSTWPADGGGDRDRFTRGGGTAEPRYIQDVDVAVASDYRSLALFTAYAHVETAQRALVEAGATELDDAVRVYFEPDVRRAAEQGLPTHDNALYFPTLDALVLMPMEVLTRVPLGMNRGVIAHELAHRAFYYAAWKGALFATKERHATALGATTTVNRISALDEGLADYLGAYVAADPDYLSHSTPASLSTPRRLDSPRSLDPTWVAGTQPLRADGSYEPFAAGAVIAAALWSIGESAGHDVLAPAVLAAERAIAGAIEAGLDYDFGDFESALATALPLEARAVACTTFATSHAAVWSRIVGACP